jgi:hypothetical protein
MRTRSFFWPFVLIAAGLVWLLVEVGTIPLDNLWALMYIWPFLLMGAGIGLILRSRWPITRMFVSGLIVLGIVLSIFFAPQLGWNQMPSWNFITWTNFNGSIRGSGNVISESRQVQDFSAVEINYPVELTVKQGQTPSLTIEGEDNLLPQLDTRVSGSTLIIENSERNFSKRVNSTKPVRINLTVKDLRRVDFPSAGSLSADGLKTEDLRISISGAGTVTLTNLTAVTLDVNLSGAGNIRADGKADTLITDISGFGSFHGDNLASQNADVTISGAGNATVWAKDSLKADISGTGSVRYYGSPSVNKSVSGVGSVSGLGNK